MTTRIRTLLTSQHQHSDPDELIAEQLMADGLSGDASQDTWMLNSRITAEHSRFMQDRSRLFA
jgi:hypothetical protein